MRPAIQTEATTDEIAGRTIERWYLLCSDVITRIDENEYHALREAILMHIRIAVEIDRDGRLDYSPEAVTPNQ